jgi:hypothetical protein
MMAERQVSIDTIDAINLSLVAHHDHRDLENAPRAATWASRSICTPRSGRTVADRSPGCLRQVRRWHAVARGYALLRGRGFAEYQPPPRARHPWSTGMTRASPCRRPRADRADGVSFDITKTNSSATFSVLATAMLLGLSDPDAKLFGYAEPRRREGRVGLGAGGWDAQLLYELDGDRTMPW